ncbi:hypothetical protein [Oricola sp.]|uniref:hypothetical protein n=1 Tax=Oricola sp. TaxID=1979950 RepID=UPI003BAB99AE
MSRSLADMQRDVEAVSQIYARYCGFERDADWYVMKVQEEAGETVSAYLRMTLRGRHKGDTADEIRRQFEDELSDLLASVLLVAEKNGVDLQEAMERKWFSYLKASAD